MEPESSIKCEERLYDCLVVGAGFAGLYQLYRLRQEGFDVYAVDAGADVGGTWYWNCYPGARVDTDCHVYQFSMEEIWHDWVWEERFPGRDEMRRYFQHLDKRLDLSRDISFETRVTRATFDQQQSCWIVETEQRNTLHAKFLLLCTGFASQPYTPPFKDLDSFAGIAAHSARWPQTGVEMRGKKVGVIGTGASGIQIAQEAAKVAAHLTIFQRTPNLCLPMGQERYSREDNKRMKNSWPQCFAARPHGFSGIGYDFIQQSAFGVPDDERRATYQRLWNQGGFSFWLGAYQDLFTDLKSNRAAYDFWRDQVLKRVSDPWLAEKLAPQEPPHPFGVKRPSLEQEFYEIFDQGNVDLICLKDTPIERITPAGVMTSARQVELDVLALATGFDAVTGGLTAIDIVGIDGDTLREKWIDGVRTHLGIACAEFPNLLVAYGPQAPTISTIGPTSAEYQGEWLVAILKHMRDNNIARFDIEPATQEAWRSLIMDMTEKTLFMLAESWYVGANIPGKKKEMSSFPGGLVNYLAALNKCSEQGYSGFLFS